MGVGARVLSEGPDRLPGPWSWGPERPGPRPPVCLRHSGEGRGRPLSGPLLHGSPCRGHSVTTFHWEELPEHTRAAPRWGHSRGFPGKSPRGRSARGPGPQNSSPGTTEPQRLTRHRVDE